MASELETLTYKYVDAERVKRLLAEFPDLSTEELSEFN